MNYILSYYQQISDGTIVAGVFILAIYKYLVEGLEEGKFFFDAKKANRAIKFIENFCHHCEGKNSLLKLELWQKALVSAIFGIVDKSGNRQFREVLLVIGRKNGKTLFASAIAACCLYIDGEYGANVFCVAPKLEQANIVYNDIWQTVSMEPELASKIKRRKSDYYIEETNSSVKKIAFNAKKSDGFNPHLCICDEIASWPGDQGLKQYEVMKSALGARVQPIILSITTAGYIDDGIFDELMKRCTRFLSGDSGETRLLPILYMIDDVSKWNDINELKKANPNLGVSITVDYMLEEIAIAEGSLSKRTEFLCKYCNIKQNSSMAWLRSHDVRNMMCDAQLDDFVNSYAVSGIDLSQTTDLTAAITAIEKDGITYLFGRFWLPAEKIQEATERDGIPYQRYVEQGFLNPSGENFIDYHDCYNWMTHLIEQKQIYSLKVGYDRYSAQYLVQDMANYGFQMDDVYQGDNLYPILQEIEGRIKDGTIKIAENNNLLMIHFLNAAIRMNTERGRGRLVKINATAHIDGVAATADAMCVRSKWYSEIGYQLTNAS